MTAIKSTIGLLALLVSSISWALDAPSAWVEAKADQIISAIQAADISKEDKPGQRTLAEAEIIPHVDVEGIAMRSVGRPWRQLSEPDRARFVAGMKTRLLDLYGGAFVQFKEADIEVLNERIGKRGDRAIVMSRLRQPGQDWLSAEFRLIADNDQWRVLDVAIEGVSLLNSYKATIDEKVSRLGLDGAVDEVAQGR